MISLNLLPDIKKDLLKVRRERNLVISVSIVVVAASVIALLVLGGTLGGFTIAKTVMEGNISKDEDKIKDAQNNQELNEYLTVQNQLAQIGNLKNKQEIYSRLMDYLKQLNPSAPNSVFIRSATITSSASTDSTPSELSGTGTSIMIEGRTGNFSSLDVYKNTLAKAQIVYEEEGAVETETATNEGAEAGSEAELAINNATRENLFSEVVVQQSTLTTGQTGTEVSFTIVATFNPIAFSSDIINPTLEVPRETTSDGDRNAPKETFQTVENSTEVTAEGGDQ